MSCSDYENRSNPVDKSGDSGFQNRFERECAKLNPDEEKALAEEGLSSDAVIWSEY
jgi:hypothetical protein